MVRGPSLVAVAALVAGSAIFSVANPTNPVAIAQEPPAPPYRIGYVNEDVTVPSGEAPSRDIWSADARGQDRRNVTDRPELDESEPAWSLDGTRLAYVQESGVFQPTQVMIAGADGTDPRPLTAPDPDANQRHPSWSPDGTVIALAREQLGEGITSSVQVVRVEDGSVLAEVPMPAHLSGDDYEPAWSPGGDRIALTRRAAPVPSPPVDPPTTERPAITGGSFTIDTTVRTPVVPPLPDIVLLIDTSGSMGDEIEDVKENLATIVTEVTNAQPQAHFAVASFTGHEDPVNMFRVRIDLTDPAQDSDGNGVTDVAAAVDGLGLTGGASEVWAHALRQVASPDVLHYRAGSSRIVVLIGDEPNTNGPGEGDTIPDAVAALREEQIQVVAVDSGALNQAGDATDVTEGTGGVYMPFNPDNPGQVSQAILDGIRQLPVRVTPVATACDPGLSVAFQPAEVTVPGGQDARFQETVRVAGSAVPGSKLNCTVEFRLNGEPTARPGFTQRVSVQVIAPQLPVVAVDDVTVEATGPAGAVVDYEASAVDAAGRPLTPACDPPPGATFPVGVTVVTCTATDDAGNVGSDTAKITVVGSESERERLWLIGIERPTPDTVAITDQIDLSAAIGEACAGGHDQADWSPDGRSLVFRLANPENVTLCVVDADGGNARRPIADDELTPIAFDPAWSPDGALIAFSALRGEENAGQLWTVPAGGGTPTLLIDTPGGAEQPAFQRLGDLALSGRAVPASIPVGGRSIVELAVTNRGLVAAPDVELTLTVPASLRPEELTTTRGTCTALRCALGVVASNETVTVRLLVTGLTVGRALVQASINTAGSEPNPADNQVSVEVTVTEVPVPPPSSIDPQTVDRPAHRGTQFTVDKIVHTVGVLPESDIVLLIDDTGSMAEVISDVRRDMQRLIAEVHAKQPSAFFGIAAFRDEVDGPGLDFRVEQQPIAADSPEQLRLLDEAMGRLPAEGGGDTPEDWINALYQVATGAVTFRPDGNKIVVLIGDAQSHDPSLGHTLAEAAGALNRLGVRVVAVPTGFAELDLSGQATRIAEATRGTVLAPTSDPTKVAEAVAAGVTSLPVTITPVVVACDPGLAVSFSPPGPVTVSGGQDAKYVETVRVAESAVLGAVLRCTVEFRVDGEPTVRPGHTQQITVRVGQPVLTVEPQVGPPGLVTRAVGAGFPPGATVRLSWSIGISETPGVVTVDQDGAFDAQVLIFHNDLIGLRELLAEPVTGPPVGTMRSQPFLVVPRSLKPPSFQTRR